MKPRKPEPPKEMPAPKPAFKTTAEKNAAEVKICGIRAVHALVSKRIEDVIRVYLTEPNLKQFSQLMKWCAENRKAYHVVTAEEMETIAATVHHEGICVLAKRAPQRTFEDLLAAVKKSPKEFGCIIYLDGVQNPHNVGAVIRTCAHFGVRLILVDGNKFPQMSPSVFRTAEGGAEAVEIIPLANPINALQDLQKTGYALAATADKGQTNLYQWKMPAQVVLMMGSETYGLTSSILRIADVALAIPSFGSVESLNVACASAVVISEYNRARQT